MPSLVFYEKGFVSMSNLEFDGDIARIQERISETPAFHQQRARTLEAIAPAPADCILDIGCGTGHMLLDLANIISDAGRVVGIDVSEDMVAIAKERCKGCSTVEVHTGDLYDLPFENNSFDRALSVQVFEYLENIPAALSEIYRVLRPEGRIVIRDADWATQIWRAQDPQRSERVMKLWDEHLVDPNMPQTFTPKLRDAGFNVDMVEAVTSAEIDASEDSMNHYLMQFISPFAVAQGMEKEEVDAWLADLAELNERGDYFYSFTGYIFVGTKI